MHDLDDIGSWLQLLSGLFIVALGVFVASIRPRMMPKLAFSAFAASFGGVFSLTNGSYLAFDQPPFDAHPLVEIPRIALYMVAVSSLVAMALLFPVPMRRSERAAASASSTSRKRSPAQVC